MTESQKMPPSSAVAGLKKILWFAAKLALAGGIVGYMFFNNKDAIIESFRTFHYLWLIPAALLYWSHMAVCAMRWYALTRVLAIDITRGEAFSLTMQSNFFSLVMPGGAIGGDVVKIGVLAARSTAGSRVEGAFSILMDRIVGMIALFATTIVVAVPTVGVLMNISVPEFEIGDSLKILGICGLFGLCLAGIGASMVIFFHRQIERIRPIGFLMQKVDRWTHGALRRMTAATDLYRRNWKVVFYSVLVSVPFVHLLAVAVFGCLVAGLGTGGVSALVLIAAVVIGNIAGLIPLFPGGVGGRDLTTITILAAGGMAVPEAKAAMLLYTALMVLSGITCGLFFIFDSGKSKRLSS